MNDDRMNESARLDYTQWARDYIKNNIHAAAEKQDKAIESIDDAISKLNIIKGSVSNSSSLSEQINTLEGVRKRMNGVSVVLREGAKHVEPLNAVVKMIEESKKKK